MWKIDIQEDMIPKVPRHATFSVFFCLFIIYSKGQSSVGFLFLEGMEKIISGSSSSVSDAVVIWDIETTKELKKLAVSSATSALHYDEGLVVAVTTQFYCRDEAYYVFGWRR